MIQNMSAVSELKYEASTVSGSRVQDRNYWRIVEENNFRKQGDFPTVCEPQRPQGSKRERNSEIEQNSFDFFQK